MGVFRFALMAFLAIAVIDVVLVWALYVVHREIHRDLVLLADWSRLVYAVLAGLVLAVALPSMLAEGWSGL